MPNKAKLPTLTREQFAVGNTQRHAFVGEEDNLPGKPDISRWTWPTYYARSYLAIFRGFALDLEKPLIIEEIHYDPLTHREQRRARLLLRSPTVIRRPEGTYISIRFAPENEVDNPDIELEDIDIDKDEDI